MNDRRWLVTGAAGSFVAALCCFTPVLVVLLGAVGLSAWLAWLDYVLLPVLVVCLAIALAALLRMRARAHSADRP